MRDEKNVINENKITDDTISITKALKGLYVLPSACIKSKEPVLLVGNTGYVKLLYVSSYPRLLVYH